MKKAVTTAAALICFCMLCGFTPRMPEMFDGADLFTAEEEKRLLEEAEKTAERTETQIVFLTYEDAGGRSTEKYTDDFCDDREFGYGGDEEKTFMMLAIDMDNREVYVKTGGTAIARVTDREIEYILDEVFEWMPDRDYYRAAETFLEAAEKALEEDLFSDTAAGGEYGYGADEREPDRTGYGPEPEKEAATAKDILMRFLIAVGVGGAVTGLMLLGRKTGSRPGNAAYMASSPRVLHRSDRYINTTVVKTRINTDKDSGSSGGGSGGSFHTSSGGNSYGGGGRSF